MMINGLLVGLAVDLMEDILVAYNESWIQWIMYGGFLNNWAIKNTWLIDCKKGDLILPGLLGIMTTN